MRSEYITLGRNAKRMAGQRFGRLTVLGPVGRTKGRAIVWLCRCDCGNEIEVVGRSLRSGNTRSCGCLYHAKGGAP